MSSQIRSNNSSKTDSTKQDVTVIENKTKEDKNETPLPTPSSKAGPKATSTPKKSGVSIQELDASSQYLVPSEPEKYTPMPYTFRVPTEPQTKQIKDGYARCPPFYLQLDHTLAVVWCLFCKQKITRPLGIAQLQWALSFLKGICHNNGESPADVATCIQAIENELIDEYAALADDDGDAPPPEKAGAGGGGCCANGGAKPADTKSKSNQPSKAQGGKPSEEAKREEAKREEAKREEAKREEAKRQEAKREETKQNGSKREESSKQEESKKEETDTKKPRSTKSEMTTKNLPFSVNYSDMMKSCPVCVEQLYKSNNMTDEEMRREYEQTKQGDGKSRSQLDANCSREDMVNFLKTWRQEQIDKIQAELKRLHSIENFMDMCDKEKCDAYADSKDEKNNENTNKDKEKKK